MTETATARGRGGDRFVDKVVRQIGRKRLVLRGYLSGGRLVRERLYLSTLGPGSSEDREWFDSTTQAARALEVAEASEPDWLLTRGEQVGTSRPRRESWELRRDAPHQAQDEV